MCERYFSVGWEYEAEAVNFFRQRISPEEYCWVFPHPHFTAKTIGHLADCGARGDMLLVYFPSMPGFFRVFFVGKVANFVRNYYQIWMSPAGDESFFFRGPARNQVFLIEFDLGVQNPLSFV